MNITKDAKIISAAQKDPKTEKIVQFEVGPALGEVEGTVTYDAMINNIEKGQVYQVQAYDSADPSNVVVKDMADGTKILTTGKDENELNNLKDLKCSYVGANKVVKEDK